jgi:hypothetical protein
MLWAIRLISWHVSAIRPSVEGRHSRCYRIDVVERGDPDLSAKPLVASEGVDAVGFLPACLLDGYTGSDLPLLFRAQRFPHSYGFLRVSVKMEDCLEEFAT